jgi:hypothetical protein
MSGIAFYKRFITLIILYVVMDESDFELEHHTSTGRKILFVLWTLLFISGVSLYLIWAALYDAWFDVGLYSVTVSMILLGLVEMYINFPK